MVEITISGCCGPEHLTILNSHREVAFYECKKCGKQFHGHRDLAKSEPANILPPATPVQFAPVTSQKNELPPNLLKKHLASGQRVMAQAEAWPKAAPVKAELVDVPNVWPEAEKLLPQHLDRNCPQCGGPIVETDGLLRDVNGRIDKGFVCTVCRHMFFFGGPDG